MSEPEDDDDRSPDETDDEMMARHAEALAAEAVAAIPTWVRERIGHIAEAWRAGLSHELAGEADAAAERAVEEVGTALRDLLALDVDEQRIGPLQVLRRLTPYPTAVLEAAGIPEVERDDGAVAAFPTDRYDLVPASFADFGPEVHEAGMRWGAAKAHVVLRRRRAEGLR